MNKYPFGYVRVAAAIGMMGWGIGWANALPPPATTAPEIPLEQPQQSGKVWNLRQADILSVIDAVSQETGKNFIIDPRVKGHISIVSHTPLDTDALYQVFLSALHVLGYTLVEGPQATRIVPDAQVKSLPTKVVRADKTVQGDEMVVQVIPVRQVSAAALVPVVRNLVAQNGHLAPYPPANVLIVADLASNVQRLIQVIQEIEAASSDDIDWITLKHHTASELVYVLNPLVAGSMRGPDTTSVLLAADDRSNAILMGGDTHKRARIRALIEKLDVPASGEGHTDVVYLKYQRAEDLVPVLKSVMDAFENTQSNSIPVGKPPGLAGSRDGIPRDGSRPMPSWEARPGITSMQRGDFSDGLALAPMERTSVGVPGIQSEPHTNALILSATPQLMRTLKQVIAKLDIRRRQVLVEAAIVELSADMTREFGINWLHYKTTGLQGGMAFPGNGIPSVNVTSTLSNQGTAVVAPTDAAWGGGGGLAIGFIRQGNLQNLIAALAADQHTNVLSTPALVALDNQKSQLVVGQQLPFRNGSYASTSQAVTATPFNTIEYRDVALSLEIVPQITKGRAVQLDLDQQVNQLVSSADNQPITSKRQIKTSVLVNDGDVLVLGGLMETKDTETWQRVPILGDIPLFGGLFAHKLSKRTKTNLVVFIKPTILKENTDTVRITGAKYAELENHAVLAQVTLPALTGALAQVDLPEPFGG